MTLAPEILPSGFSFDLCQRNEFLLKKGFVAPKATKTGTTIAGIIFKDGVILGADTRATAGPIIADKNCQKIHRLASNIYCCGAGTAADTDSVTRMIESNLELFRLNTGRQPRVVTAEVMLKRYLFKHQGYVSAALVLGGVDLHGPHLCCIFPHGSTDNLPYTTMGSGSLAAMAMFESGWKPDMTEEEGKKLVADAIRAGITEDMYSGSHVDLCIIRRNNFEYIRPYDETCKKGEKQLDYKFKRGTTEILSKVTRPIIIEEEIVRTIEPESMDTSS